MAFYGKLHAVNLAAFDEIDESLTDYFDAVEDEDVRVEAAANLLSILYLLFSIDRSKSYIRENKPAAVMMAAKKDEKVKRAVQEMDFSFDSDTDALSDDSDEKEIKDEMAEWLLAVKKSGEWSNLADYYLALRYVLNLVDNDLDWGYNQRIGIEMMYSFLSVKNKYAARFIKLNNKVLSK